MRRKIRNLMLGCFVLLMVLVLNVHVKADTISVRSFPNLKKAIETAGSNRDIIVENDIAITGQMNVPTNANINLMGANNTIMLIRDEKYDDLFFNLSQGNTNLNITSLIIDGNKDKITALTWGRIFMIQPQSTTVTVGKDAIIRNQKTIGNNGSVAWIESGILEFVDNAKLCDNESSHAVIYANGTMSSVIFRDNSEAFNNKAINGTDTWVDSAVLINNGETLITGYARIHNNESYGSIGAIWNTYSGTLIIEGNSSIDNNRAGKRIGAIYNNNTLIIRESANIHNNSAQEDVGGILSSFYSQTGQPTDGLVTLTIRDNAYISHNNSQDNYGAIFIDVDSEAYISDSVHLQSNESKMNGGAIGVGKSSSLFIDGDVFFDYNGAASGGAIYSEGTLDISGDTIILGNYTTGGDTNIPAHGGALKLVGKDNSTTISGQVNFEGNNTDQRSTNVGNGGAIFISSDVGNPVQISDDVIFRSNTAVGDGTRTGHGDGGAIYTEKYENLMVGKKVNFIDNQAGSYSNIDLPNLDPANYAIYQTNIAVPNNKWTNNYTYGYNNYDINYKSLTKEHLLKYDLNGGQGTLPNEQKIQENDQVIVDFTMEPTLSNHKFLGYSTDENDTKAMYTSNGTKSFNMPNHDVTLYAIYTPYFTIETSIEGGVIDKSPEVLKGENIKINFKGNDGLLLSKIIVDDKEVKLPKVISGSYEFKNVTKNHTIKVIFSKDLNFDNNNDYPNDNNKIPDNKNNNMGNTPQTGNNVLSYVLLLVSITSLLSGLFYCQRNNLS
ncbi:MAG: InlB B-repeat-containing protein [Bacilli bacterium]|jgi:predicted outer membrane repeat protein|nr:InlB B-repeat-containing protein [Bacilli bacterium]